MTHKSTDRLSEQAWALMRLGFRQKWTAAEIASRVLAATGEVVKARTISHRMREWRVVEAQRVALSRSEPEEVFNSLLDQVDFSCGSYLRRRQKIHRVLDFFLRNPSPSALRALKDQLLVFWLESCGSGEETR